MAFERMGLGGKLTFEEAAAVASLRRATQSFDALLSSATRAQPPVSRFGARFQAAGAQVRAGSQMMRGGMGQMQAGATTLAMGLAPVAIAMAGGMAKAAGFEKQMSGVAAITRASADELAGLTAEAKRQGIVSVFSASQSAEAMENLGRAGFTTSEILDGLGGVMAAAAAEGVTLAQSSDVIARVVRGMGQEAADAAHIADILTLTSAKSNTTILDLGESFKYGASQAKTMGISTEETAAVFGKLADAGLRGSIAGTSFTNMMVKLSKPSKEATKIIDKWGIKLTDSTGALLPMPKIIDQFKARLDKLPDTVERARIQTELFGIRGAKAYSALSLAGGDALAELTQDLVESSFGIGAAQEAANKRLDNFLGAFTLFGSSLEATAIEFFGPLLGGFQTATEDMTGSLNSVLLSVQALKANQESFGVIAARVGKEQAKSLVQQDKILAGLSEREQVRARGVLSGLTRQALVNETLTKEQSAARTKALVELQKQTALGREMSTAEQLAHRARMINMIEQTAAQQRIQVEARALLENEKRMNEIEAEHGRTARIIAQGVLDAIEGIKAGFATVIERIKAFANELRESVGEEQLQRYVKIGTTIAALAGIVTPAVLALGLFTMVAKGALLPVLGLGKVVWGLGLTMKGLAGGAATGISAAVSFVTKIGGLSNLLTLALFKVKMAAAVAFATLKGGAIAAMGGLKAAFVAALPVIWPVVAVGGALVAAFMLVRREGESVGETLSRVWETIKAAVATAWTSTIKPVLMSFLEGFRLMGQGIAEIWAMLWPPIRELAVSAWGSVVEYIGAGFQIVKGWISTAGQWWGELWDSAAESVGGILTTLGGFVTTAIEFWAGYANQAFEFLAWPFRKLAEFISPFVQWVIELFDTKLGRSIKKIATGWADVLLSPFRLMLAGLLKIANALPSAAVERFISKDTLARLEGFAKHGFAGPPDKTKDTVDTVKQGAEDVAKVIPIDQARRANLPPDVQQVLTARAMPATDKNVALARAILQQKQQMEREDRARKEKAAEKELKAEVKIEDNRKIDVQNKMCVDGEGLSVAKSRHEQSIFERSGGRTTPFIRRRAAETGVRVASSAMV